MSEGGGFVWLDFWRENRERKIENLLKNWRWIVDALWPVGCFRISDKIKTCWFILWM